MSVRADHRVLIARIDALGQAIAEELDKTVLEHEIIGLCSPGQKPDGFAGTLVEFNLLTGNFEELAENIGTVGTIINNQQVTPSQFATEYPEAHPDNILTLNLRVPTSLARSFASRSESPVYSLSRVLNLSVPFAEVGSHKNEVAVASRAGLYQVTRNLTEEFRRIISVGVRIHVPWGSPEFLAMSDDERLSYQNEMKFLSYPEMAIVVKNLTEAVSHQMKGECRTIEIWQKMFEHFQRE